ncbi:WD repeat protein [Aspergillus heteromorphus CBS 117.55]|uniref:WD repeat protein n=1 Tax=Aspergillus heteromorphus CBS 117.55 TaxID=1448321 RepID=A0A317WE36_9EURO|nr:WD repeat protein [Aspergillus heteromorphus CBS 117.55]PWY83492.1 WD repeat protein [Aspergillus heteromorphus CBS 117.55]
MVDLNEARLPTSAFESPTFGEDSSFHVEQPVGSMSISPCGRDVVLASKEGLHIIDLDSPYSPPRYLPHHTPWEVADVQWSPFSIRDYWVVSTSNQKALVWNLAMQSSQNSIEHVLHAHTRAITDINFSAHHADMLATCAVDSFVHCWDLRTPSRPAISFSDWLAGATQVKWNRQDPHVIASSHDKFLRIWDKRMGAYPIKSIEAHSTKIYGVDWNRVRPGALVTCSLDKTIKFWDYTVNTEVPEKVIKTPFPVWRARNTPFGWGVLAMPQRGNSDLHLYSRRAGDGAAPTEDLPLVHSFPGHKGQVKEFLWRARGGVTDGVDNREFQLVSWGTDRELRLHRADQDVLERVGFEKGKSFGTNLHLSRQGALYRSFRDISYEQEDEDTEVLSPTTRQSATPQTIGMQGRTNVRNETNPIAWMRGITHVGEKFTKVAFESVDVRQRKATISLHGPWAADGDSLFLKVDIKFPVDYPRAIVPTFSLADKILAELRTIAETYLAQKRGCLEGVESIAWILGETAETIKSPVNGHLGGEESSDEDEVGLSQSQDLGMSSELLRPVNANVMVPVAKGCGALWANDGRLVCFFPSKKDKSNWLSRADKVFEGFGRLRTSSPGPPRTSITMASTDDGASEYSDDSDAETSSSSGSSGILSGLQHRFTTPQTWRSGGSLGIYRPRSTDNSQRSTVGAMTAKSSEGSQNVISIHDFSDLLPAKRELASEYRICGKVTDVCAHNAAVALDHGHHELARIWGLVRLILHNCKTSMMSYELDRLERPHIQRKDSAVDLTYDTGSQRSKESASSVIQWGDHPFGGHWLIPALFEHFEQIGDVQMIAMLSCVLYEPSIEEASSREQLFHHRTASRRMEEHSFSFDLYSPNSIMQNKPQVATPTAFTQKDSHPTPITHSSGRSSSEVLRADSEPPFSTGTTPPIATRTGPLAAERKHWGQNISMAASPDQQSQPRSASGLGSALASSLSRSLTFGPSSASPPATAISRKSLNASGSPNAIGGPGVWVTSAFAAKPATAIPDYLTTSTALTSQTHSDTESERRAPSKAPAKVRAVLKNQAAFKSTGRTQNSFLDPKKDWMYRSYRAAYAHLLSIWGLPVQRSEVLKIGGTPKPSTKDITHRRRKSHHDSFSLPVSRRRSSLAVATETDNQGLEIQRHCIGCGQPLQLSIFAMKTLTEAAPRSHLKGFTPPPSHAPTATPNTLSPSNSPVSSAANCFDCHRGWFSMASSDPQHHRHNMQASEQEEHQFCPTGCGCKCSDYIDTDADTDIPTTLSLPRHHRNKPSDGSGSGSSKHGAADPSAAASVGQHEEDLDGWQNASPFASLARGLGGGLSRGLRVKDVERKKSKNTPAAPFVPKRSSMNQVESR